MSQPKTSQPSGRLNVLHVDDEPFPLKDTKSFVELADESIHIESVATHEEALKRLIKDQYDCIVSDYRLPGIDGIELAKKVRETSSIPFIIYTGQGSEEVAEAAFEVGIDDYMRKELNPSHYQVLARRIRIAVEKQRAERALQRQLKETHIILDSVPAIIFYKDKENRLVTVNQALIDSSGLTREELEGRDLAEIYPDLADNYWKDDLEVINTGQAKHGIVEPLETPDGVRWLTTDKMPYRNEKGEITGIIGFSIDITERIQVEDELRKSEERYRGLFELSPDVIITGDMKGFITSANPAFTRATGYPVENIIGKHFTMTGYLLADELPRFMLMFSTIVRGKTIPPIEFQFKHKEGTVRWAEAHIGFREIDGKKVGVQGVIRDITERKIFETRLEVLHTHALELASADGIESIADVTLEAIKSVFGYQWSDFNIVEDDNLVPLLVSDEELLNNMTLPLDGPGITVRAYRTGETQLVHDVRQDKDYVIGRGSEGEMWLSELAVPVKIDDEVVAVINIEDKRLSAFTDNDRKLVEIFAEHVASSIARMRQVESLQESEEKYRNFIESSRDAVFVMDEEKYLYVNRRASELLGYESPETLIGKDAFQHVAPEFREMVRERAVARQRGKDQPDYYEIRLVRKDGSSVPVDVNVTSISFEGKQVSLVVNKDLSELKKNEETLLALHRHARDLARCMSLEEVYEHTVRVMTETLNFPRVDILMAEGNVLKQVTASGSVPLGVQIPLDGKGVTVKAIQEKRSLIVNDVSQSGDYIYAIGDSGEPFGGYPLSHSELVSPIIVKGEAIGVLNVESTELDAFTEQNRMFLELLAMHVASAIDRLYQLELMENLVEGRTSKTMTDK